MLKLLKMIETCIETRGEHSYVVKLSKELLVKLK